ncbi:hypothetical protein F7Q99_36930 [Streptomyces kaniharaensis]|uniref:Uncharacterized protein n=1 Tax=Streptomyces kaniharaensis TaxID=212423 RepID=A0A6N7L462_9ACTN|nr:hypothetical protein [Streptomyces kaniharaensis]MQS17627.1 hypothetical protein [Streptomyces kaniharaensis]
MTSYVEDLERVEKELREAERERDLLGVRIEGLRAQREAFRKLVEAPAVPGEDLKGLKKADAIVKILQASDKPMTLGEIADAMSAAGKKTQKDGASVYIDGLLKAGRVIRVQRGQYRAA